ncbi:LuxR C-terminal-related transcriptional regulator, partial [Klebsiella pneumoniae]|uniref:LuxR C-terminal-related transcriptional regulator n=3 Tax=Klebsiella pneumoniae TaxID=573 RepID=UPI001E63583E
KSAQIREILISESAWEEMTCLFAPSIAQKLGISHKTIFSHKINIMKKFQIATKQELTRFSSVALALSAGRIG